MKIVLVYFSLRKLEVAESKCLVLTVIQSRSACPFPGASHSHKASIKNREDETGTKFFLKCGRPLPENTDELLLLEFCPLFALHVSQFVG
jgi:hypothetical protein